jgi:hypothetical protein
VSKSGKNLAKTERRKVLAAKRLRGKKTSSKSEENTSATLKKHPEPIIFEVQF